MTTPTFDSSEYFAVTKVCRPIDKSDTSKTYALTKKENPLLTLRSKSGMKKAYKLKDRAAIWTRKAKGIVLEEKKTAPFFNLTKKVEESILQFHYSLDPLGLFPCEHGWNHNGLGGEVPNSKSGKNNHT